MELAKFETVTKPGVIKEGQGALFGVLLTAGTVQASATIYDGTAKGGAILCQLKTGAGSSAAWTPAVGYKAQSGIYCDMFGTGAVVTVVYL